MGARGRSGHTTSPDTIEAREKAASALELRKQGKTFLQIAKELGYNSPQASHDAVKRALDRVIREPANDLIRLELERLDEMWQIAYLNSMSGDPVAIASCLKIMERRARLLGLDAPNRLTSEITGPNGGPVAVSNVTAQVLREIPTERLESILAASSEDAGKN